MATVLSSIALKAARVISRLGLVQHVRKQQPESIRADSMTRSEHSESLRNAPMRTLGLCLPVIAYPGSNSPSRAVPVSSCIDLKASAARRSSYLLEKRVLRQRPKVCIDELLCAALDAV